MSTTLNRELANRVYLPISRMSAAMAGSNPDLFYAQRDFNQSAAMAGSSAPFH
jgi:hypothetical protein